MKYFFIIISAILAVAALFSFMHRSFTTGAIYLVGVILIWILAAIMSKK